MVIVSQDMGTRLLDLRVKLKGDSAAAKKLLLDILPQLATLQVL